MPVSVSSIGWGSYDKYEGPYYWGKYKYTAPKDPTFEEKLLSVTTSTEGGTLDAVNMYDRCVLTVGVIQYCEAVFALSKMLGYCADSGGLAAIRASLSSLPTPLDLVKGKSGWRFAFLDGRGEINTVEQMQVAFLGGSSGLKGAYTDAQKSHARVTAAVFASMWDDISLRSAQGAYASSTILTFVTSKSKQILNSIATSRDSWDGALWALVTSYSANLPAVAERLLRKASEESSWSINPETRYTIAARHLSSGSGIKIWPERYTRIAPVISSHFGVKVPSLQDLSNSSNDDPLDTTEEMQKFLISAGYDLGPAGADGVAGARTRAAIKDFQSKNGLTADGIYGPKTKEAMMKAMTTK